MCVEGSTDGHQHLQQQDDVSSSSWSSSSSSSLCLYTVVMVTVPLCVVVLLALTAILTLYALSARRRRRMTSSPPSAAFPLPVATGCRCGGVDRDRHSWPVRCGGCRTHLPVTDCKSVQHLHQHQQLVDSAGVPSSDSRYDDAGRPSVVAPTSPSLSDERPLKPTSNHSESTLLLVARDAWTS